MRRTLGDIKEYRTLKAMGAANGAIVRVILYQALISAVELAEAAREGKRFGLEFEKLTINVEKLRGFTESVVSGLSRGIKHQ